jgi:hypothetical protein
VTGYPDWKPDVEIGVDTASGESVALPYRDRPLGVAMIGKSGRGKSTLLEHLILADIEHGTAAVAIDPHGVLAKRIARIVSPEHAEKRLILVEVDEDVAFGLNMLDIGEKPRDARVTWAADNVVGTIKRLYSEDAEFMPRLEEYLDLAVRTLIPSGRTLIDALDLFEDEALRNECLSYVTNPLALRKLRRRWAEYKQLRPADRIAHREAVRNRLERLLAPELIQNIVGAKHTTLPLDRVLNGNDTMIVSLPSAEWLSQERANFIGSLVLCVLVYHIFSRDLDYPQPRLHLYLDEYQRFASSATAELLTQGRKYNVGTTFAHQDLAQITDDRVRDSFRHAGAIIALGLTRPDADMLAGEFPVKPQPERLEMLREPDGAEAREIVTQTPGRDLILKVHSDPTVREAAGMLFSRFAEPYPAEFRSAVDSFSEQRDSRFEIYYDKLDPFLISVMSGDVSPMPEAVAQALWDMDYPPDAENYSQLFRDYRWRGWRAVPASGSDRRRGYSETGSSYTFIRYPRQNIPGEGYNQYVKDHHAAYTNQQFDVIRERECKAFYEYLRGWFFATAGVQAFEYVEDESLINYAVQYGWSGDAEAYEHVKNRHYWCWRCEAAVGVGNPPKKGASAERRAKVTAHVQFLRERFAYQQRWLTVLAEGLAKRPMTVYTSDLRPRERVSHVLHSAQTSHDALTEWAGELTHPAELHIAKVRLLTGAHEVKLSPPLAVTADVAQLKAVRARSRAMYSVTSGVEDEPEAPPLAPPKNEEPPPRRIGRRPASIEFSEDDPQEVISGNGDDIAP